MRESHQMSETERIKAIFMKQYEQRNLSEHKKATTFLEPYFSTLSTSTIKLISFYIEVIEKSKEDEDLVERKLEHGMLITITQVDDRNQEELRNPEIIYEFNIVKNVTINFNEKNSFGLYITYNNYLSCLNLGESSIEEELHFFNSSEYLCSMPKKKYLMILRNSQVLSFTYRQLIYSEGQLIVPGESGSGIYLLRQGEMAYVKKINDQSIEVLRFGSGHLLGTLEYESREEKRLFGVKCKTGRVIVYHMNEEFFNMLIKPYCEPLLIKKQKKLEKFLSDKSSQLKTFREQHEEFNITLRKSFSHADDVKSQSFKGTSTVSMFTSRDLPNLIKTERKSYEIENDELRKTSYLELRYGGSLKNYPKAIQKSNFMESEFKDLDKLKEKNEKISKIRNIKNIKSDETRQSIMFRLFQNSWRFEKERKLRKY